MAKKDNGIQEWINYCWEMMNNNPYVLPEGEVSHDFEKQLERAVKHKIYHTALYEYQLKLKKMMNEEEKERYSSMEKKNYWVSVECNSEDDKTYEWYKVSAIDEDEAIEKVIDWCKANNLWFEGNDYIECVVETEPKLITEIN